MGTQLLPNSFDGSVQTDFVALLLSRGNSPTTLQPIAQMVVVYPQGTAVWLGTASAVFDWPVAESPVLLPPLFFALSVLGFGSWGSRVFSTSERRDPIAPVIFAAGASLLLTWPRFLVAGAYDFVFCLPLFLIVLGQLSVRSTLPLRSAAEVIWLGAAVGVMTSLSPVPAEFMLSVLLVSGVTARGRSWRIRGQHTLGVVAAGLGGVALGLPSIWGLSGVWTSKPIGANPVIGVLPFLDSPATAAREFVGLSDPFLFRPEDVWLSPFLPLKSELAVLLVLGFLLLGLMVSGYRIVATARLPHAGGVHLLTGCAVGIGLLLIATVGSALLPALDVVLIIVPPGEISILLFLAYGGVSLVPRVLAGWVVRDPCS
ncbi:MAG: hypothetical protein JRN35_09320 [Nitrososphaerota archaeon]|nr:hypothetical protein [Nitrososphaerota archaeon]